MTNFNLPSFKISAEKLITQYKNGSYLFQGHHYLMQAASITSENGSGKWGGLLNTLHFLGFLLEEPKLQKVTEQSIRNWHYQKIVPRYTLAPLSLIANFHVKSPSDISSINFP
jgi:hypothetical protein